MESIIRQAEPDYNEICKIIYSLASKYPQLSVQNLSKSVMGKTIPLIKLGNGKENILYVGGVHGNERLTTIVLLKFLEEVCFALENHDKISDISADKLFVDRTLYLVPLINPDGYDISLKGETGCSEFLGKIKRLCGSNFKKWSANARGVDINHNFDAGWLALKEKEKKAGIYGPSKKQYGGSRPVSEPETAALVSLCENIRFEHAISFHSQGEVIYWSWGEKENKKGLKMAEIFAASSGYALDVPLGLALGGGFKDWFIERFNRPAFTVEIGKGENPLPFLQVNEIYEKIREMLVLGILM